MNSDDAAELARLRERAYGSGGAIDAESLDRLRQLERSSDHSAADDEVAAPAVPADGESPAGSAPSKGEPRRVPIVAAIVGGLALVVGASVAGFVIGSQAAQSAAAATGSSPSPSVTDGLVPGSPSADVQCGQLDGLIGVLVVAQSERDAGVLDEAEYSARVDGVENVLRLMPLGYTDVSSEILLVQRAAARDLDPSDEAFREAVDDAAAACADAGANLTWVVVG